MGKCIIIYSLKRKGERQDKSCSFLLHFFFSVGFLKEAMVFVEKVVGGKVWLMVLKATQRTDNGETTAISSRKT